MALSLTAVGLIAGLWLFLQLKTEMARLAGTLARPERSETGAQVALLQSRLDQLATQLDHRSSLSLASPIPSTGGLNLGKRIHVLRLSRRGDAPEHIAATLHLPRREVELLLKIHELSFKPVPSSGQR